MPKQKPIPDINAKTGQQKDHRGNVSAEVGRNILFDFVEYQQTGFNPYGRDVGSIAHHQSKDIYKQVKFINFQLLATTLAENARAILKKASQDLVTKNNPPVNTSSTAAASLPSVCKTPIHQAKSRPQKSTPSGTSERSCPSGNMSGARPPKKFSGISGSQFLVPPPDEPLMAVYPDKKRVFLQFDFEGDRLDGSANLIEISSCGNFVSHLSRVTYLEQNSGELLKINDNDSEFIQDSDQMLLQQEIDRRKKEQHHLLVNGFELLHKVQLPFPCKLAFYNNKGKVMQSFCIKTNNSGYVWAFFGLICEVPDDSMTF